MAEDFGGAVGAFFEFLVAPILVLLGGERLMTSGIDSPSAWILIVVGITSFSLEGCGTEYAHILEKSSREE